MKSRRKEMWELTCQTCGTPFLMDRRKAFKIKHGWRVLYYCSKECRDNRGLPMAKNFKPVGLQTEAERAKALNEVVDRLVRRQK